VIKLFRAEPVTESLLGGNPNYRRPTLRLPVNAPFIIDNLWEYLRPDHMPCRRHAVFASPSPALALASSASADKGSGLGVYEVVIAGEVKIAQLGVKDAKFHPDIAKVVGKLPKRITELASGSADRQAAAMLFLPGASKDEWTAIAASSRAAAALIDEMTSISSFWAEASTVVALNNGEVFFELGSGASYSPRNLLCAV